MKNICAAMKNVIENNLHRDFARIAGKNLQIKRKFTCGAPLLGLNLGDTIVTGDEATNIALKLYGNLYNLNKDNFQLLGSGSLDYRIAKYSVKEGSNQTGIDWNEEIRNKAFNRLSRNQALSVDECLDEIFDCPHILVCLKESCINFLGSGKISQYLKCGKLCLLPKQKNCVFPAIENTRPISIYSFPFTSCWNLSG